MCPMLTKSSKSLRLSISLSRLTDVKPKSNRQNLSLPRNQNANLTLTVAAAAAALAVLAAAPVPAAKRAAAAARNLTINLAVLLGQGQRDHHDHHVPLGSPESLNHLFQAKLAMLEKNLEAGVIAIKIKAIKLARNIARNVMAKNWSKPGAQSRGTMTSANAFAICNAKTAVAGAIPIAGHSTRGTSVTKV